MNTEDELRHLRKGPRDSERPSGVGIANLHVRCNGDSSLVLRRCQEVLLQTITHMPGSPSFEDWGVFLPDWFTINCAAEESKEEKERWLTWWRSLPPEERAKASRERKWSLKGWLYWLEPGNRQWFWWEAFAQDPNTVIVSLQVEEWPFAWGAFDWLARVAGGLDVTEQEQE